MPLKLDELDVKILKALNDDGRKSYREIAKIIGVSAPTVEARLKRIMNAGLITKIAPIFNIEKLNKAINMLVLLKVEESKLVNVASELTKLPEVKSVFIITGESNLLIRIAASSQDKIQKLIYEKIALMNGVIITSTQLVIKNLKDEQGVVIEPEVGIRLACDYCGKLIEGEPLILKLQDGERFLCCKTCLSAYKEKYGTRLKF
jgi:DNA-binding Lrp family transcriptional regulator